MATSNLPCGPCAYKDIHKVAQKWCTDCQEAFCKDCEKTHKSTKNLRDHKLIEIKDYVKRSCFNVQQTCEEHKKMLDSYCKTHDVPLCLYCVNSKHKSCVDIIPLEDAAKNAKTSTALTDLQDTILVGIKNIQTIIQNTNPEHLDKEEKNIQKEIREVRTKIDHHLDEMEQNLILELNTTITKYRSKQNEILKHMKESEKAMKRLKEQTNEMKNLASDLHIFLGTCKINQEVYECLNSALKHNVIDNYNVSVDIDQVLRSLLTDLKTFGKINAKAIKANIPLTQPDMRQAQIPVQVVTKSAGETSLKLTQAFEIQKKSKDMSVTGCAILHNGQLLIADEWGQNLLMQYNPKGTHVRDIRTSSKPFDLAVIDSDRVAVSYGTSRLVEILNIQKTTVEKHVYVNRSALGLSYQGGKLYVVDSGRGIVIIKTSGKIEKTLKIDTYFVNYITTTTDRIYYSDSGENTVTCCDLSGKRIWKFKDPSVKYPFGITVDNSQNVFVAGTDSNNVTLISRDGHTSKTVLTRNDGLCNPRSIYFSNDTGNLFVCNLDNTKAFLFKVNK